ncbi:hypothetical protein H0H92_009723 [Tricholoma furcatifolium]|nr:hypothetical protein H0H92_009723 [Tricholoma furcatifolium]
MPAVDDVPVTRIICILAIFDTEAGTQTDPTGGQQHWTTMQELLMQKDKEQCQSWKDEVQNILIFSALFSAVVTAFVIESQKDLQPNTAQESVLLLRQIAAQTAGKNWVAEVDSPQIDALSIWVNVFWFLSLVLSLTTALMGIVSLQWIQSHMRNLSEGPESLGMSHMHSLGLHQSYIPVVFISLPVILIFSLTFFLIGMVVFLFKLSWPAAIPVTVAIVWTFAFLIITTALPALQLRPTSSKQGKINLKCFPSPYRSPQSLLFLHPRDWRSKSEDWLNQRTQDSLGKMKVLNHLDSADGNPEPFQYDTIEALRLIMANRSAESEKERKALANCLAEVLPTHLDFFPLHGDLSDLIPFLRPSEYVPSAVFLQLQQDSKSTTREDLNAIAFLQIATCKGKPYQRDALVLACVNTTRWLFEKPRTLTSVPEKQPLDLISDPGMSHPFFSILTAHIGVEGISSVSGALEVLIDSLTHFFDFATRFQPDNQSLDIMTTHTSAYTYSFLTLSANILCKCPLSVKLQHRHEYMLYMISLHLDKEESSEYLFHTASIYASRISISTSESTLRSSQNWANFLRLVHRRHSRAQPTSQLWRALKADEVVWSDIDRAFAALWTDRGTNNSQNLNAQRISDGP